MYRLALVLLYMGMGFWGCGSSDSKTLYDQAAYMPAKSGTYVDETWQYTEDTSGSELEYQGEFSSTIVVEGNTITWESSSVTIYDDTIVSTTPFGTHEVERYVALGRSEGDCTLTAHYDTIAFSAFGMQTFAYTDVLETVCEYDDGDVVKEYFQRGLGQVARIDYDCYDAKGNFHDANISYPCESISDIRSFVNVEKSEFIE